MPARLDALFRASPPRAATRRHHPSLEHFAAGGTTAEVVALAGVRHMRATWDGELPNQQSSTKNIILVTLNGPATTHYAPPLTPGPRGLRPGSGSLGFREAEGSGGFRPLSVGSRSGTARGSFGTRAPRLHAERGRARVPSAATARRAAAKGRRARAGRGRARAARRQGIRVGARRRARVRPVADAGRAVAVPRA